MKRNMFGAVTALVLALLVNVGFAQSKTKADVPFAFHVAQSSMSDGTYSINAVADRVMQIRNDSTNAAVMVITQREESLKPQSPRLVFHKYGDSYFLAEAWSGSGDSGMEFPEGKLEQELRASSANGSGSEEVVIALR